MRNASSTTLKKKPGRKPNHAKRLSKQIDGQIDKLAKLTVRVHKTIAKMQGYVTALERK